MTIHIHNQYPQDLSNLSINQCIILAAKEPYGMGLNVFPVMRPEMVRMLASGNSKYSSNPNAKRPYLLKPFFIYRLHLCNEECEKKEHETWRPCPGRKSKYSFESLFDFSNLALMLGRSSNNMVCLDCDTQEAYQIAKQEFLSRGLYHWAFTSSRGGNILFRCAEGEIKNSHICAIPGAEVWGHHHFCVLPPSLHHSGCSYQWVYPSDSSWHPPSTKLPAAIPYTDLQWLGVKLELSKSKEIDLYGLPEQTQLLSDNNRRILVSPIHETERNILLTKPLYDIAAWVQRGKVSYREALDVLKEAASHCIPPYYPSHSIPQMLNSALNNPGLKPSREHYTGTPIKTFDITPFLSWAHDYDWRSHGRSALLDRSVFFACLRRSQMEGSYTFRASVRELAEIANIQQPYTISKALKRLCNYGFLDHIGYDESGAKRYSVKILFDAVRQHTTNSSERIISVWSSIIYFQQNLPQTSIEKDVFRALGINSYLVWKYMLQQTGNSIKDIAEARHLVYSSVQSSIKKKLVKYRLASFSPAKGVYIAIQPSYEEMEEIALIRGTLGNTEKRRRKFTLEREIRAIQALVDARNKFFNLYTNKRNMMTIPPPIEINQQLLNVKDGAAQLSTSISLSNRLILSGHLTAVRISIAVS